MKNSIRNVSGLINAAQLKHLHACVKVENGIEKLLHQNIPITFESVAKASGVSRAFLYKDPQIRERINSLKTRHQPKNSPPLNQKASDASLQAIIDAQRYHIQQQHKEINILTNLLGGSYLTPEQIEQYDFMAENERLREELYLTQNLLDRAIRDHQELAAKVNQLKTHNQQLNSQLTNCQLQPTEQSELKKQNSDVTELLQQAISSSRQENMKMFAQALKKDDKLTDSSEIYPT